MRAPNRHEKRKEIYWRKMLARFSECGLTQVEFCKREGVNPSNFGWWKRELAVRDVAPARNGIEFARDPADEQKENDWRNIVARFSTSGLSKDDFCKKEGIKAQAFCWWRGELGRRDGDRKVRASRASASTAKMFVPLKPIESKPEPAPLPVAEIDIHQGTIRIFDNASIQTIAMLFNALRRSAE